MAYFFVESTLTDTPIGPAGEVSYTLVIVLCFLDKG